MSLKKVLKSLKEAIVGGTQREEAAKSDGIPKSPDGFPLDPLSPHFSCHCRINEFLTEVGDFTREYSIRPASYESGRRILEAPAEERILAVEAMMLRRAWVHKEHPSSFSTSFGILHKLTNLLFRRGLPYRPAQAVSLVLVVAAQLPGTHWFDDDLIPILKICERLKAQKEMTPDLQQALQRLKAAMKPGSRWESAARNRQREAIDRLIARKQIKSLDTCDDWTESISNYLASLDEKKHTAWDDLIAHARTASQSKPPARWLKEADPLIADVGVEEFKARIAEWFPLVRSSGQPNRPHANAQIPINERNADVLKGFVWCCSRLDDEKVIRAVSDLAQTCFKKVPGWGPLSNKVGNACLHTLSQFPGLAPVAQLSRLRLKIKYAVALRLIDRALQDAATRLGMTGEELEEIAVPTYGLNEDGCLREEFGEFTAELSITGTYETELIWRKQDGRAQKSVPTQIKEQFAEDWKELKRAIQDIEKMLPAQRDRMERLLLAEREWKLDEWRERYLNHPLLANLTRRLVWHFRSGDHRALAIWCNGQFVDVENRPLDWLDGETKVRFWHPIEAEVETVAAWRHWLESHQVTQPFKQAHREVYILTDAELTTDTYSNRFAAHIIKQHQFTALARQRGWKYALQGQFDSHNTPTLLLPRWNLAVEFWVNPPGGNEDVSEMGIYLHLSTDQVRFRDRDGQLRPLSEVPALVFSEVMRDVDLFVGVCSIGNDAAWQDSGDMAAYGAYWHQFSFGDLSATASTRKEVLQRLVPRLKIAGQCSFADKFLVVKGSLRTYKIHLGSGNILMAPNDQYLCIVPDRGGASGKAGEKVFLPFEGDSTLSIILSKAFLLAEDGRIKDPTILRQIKAV